MKPFQALLVATCLMLPLVGVAQNTELSGVWGGQLSANDQTIDAEWEFSANGFPIFSYVNNQGAARTVELSQVGQKIQYVPKGGGVQTYVLQDMSLQPNRLAYVVRSSFERSRNGDLDQQYSVTQVDLLLTTAGLKTTLVVQSESYLSDKDLSTGGPSQTVYSGLLQRLRKN